MYSAESSSGNTVPSRIRWLAIAAGCFSGLVGFLHYGPFFLLVPSVLILGAIIQPWSPRPGRWCLALGACIVTFYASFLAMPAVLLIKHLRLHHNFEDLIFLCLFLASVALVGWCDVALAVDARRSRGAPGPKRHVFPRIEDWIAWIIAFCLSLLVFPYSVRGILLYGRNDHLDTLLLSMLLGLVIVLFDIALLINAVKMRRAQRSRKS